MSKKESNEDLKAIVRSVMLERKEELEECTATLDDLGSLMQQEDYDTAMAVIKREITAVKFDIDTPKPKKKRALQELRTLGYAVLNEMKLSGERDREFKKVLNQCWIS